VKNNQIRKYFISNKYLGQLLKFEFIMLFAFLILAIVIIGKAFIVEDAFIDFILIQNFHDGYYLSMIPDVRSLTVTNPLWLLLLLAGSFVMPDLLNLCIYLCFFMHNDSCCTVYELFYL